AALSALWLTSAMGEVSNGRSMSKGLRIAQTVSLALFVVVGLALAAFVVSAPQRFGMGTPRWLYAAAALAAIAVIAVIPLIVTRRFGAAMAMASLAALSLYALAGFATVPRLTELWLSPRLADAVARHAMSG